MRLRNKSAFEIYKRARNDDIKPRKKEQENHKRNTEKLKDHPKPFHTLIRNKLRIKGEIMGWNNSERKTSDR